MMKALRIRLTQSSANYRREETDKNRMTYPLPPLSTIIGAIHSACNFTEYHPMDISIQGKFKSMHREPYTDYCFLNSVQNDRGILVKLNNDSMLSRGFTRVAESKKSQGNDIRKGITIKVCNDKLLQEYRDLLDVRDSIDKFKKDKIKTIMELIKKRKKDLALKKKKNKDDKLRVQSITNREKEIKLLEKNIKERLKKYEEENFDIPYSKFRSLTTSLKYYEILDDIELIIHVKSQEDLLITILDNVYNIKSIGRSEDFIDIKDAKIVELSPCTKEIDSPYSAYLNYDDVVNSDNGIYTKSNSTKEICGTKYYINKNYVYSDKDKKLTRSFNKCKVIYASDYSVDEDTSNVLIDNDGEKEYIVNFI